MSRSENDPDNKADVIFHPVRIRIVQAFFGGRRLTARQLAQEPGSASSATLYRHLNRLVQAGILTVAEQRPNRGTLEKVYAMADEQAATFAPDEFRQISPADQMRHFHTLVGTLLGDFGRYLGQPGFDRDADGVIVRQEAFYVTDAEARRLREVLTDAIAPVIRTPPEAGRRRRMLTLILLPVGEAAEQPAETD